MTREGGKTTRAACMCVALLSRYRHGPASKTKQSKRGKRVVCACITSHTMSNLLSYALLVASRLIRNGPSVTQAQPFLKPCRAVPCRFACVLA